MSNFSEKQIKKVIHFEDINDSEANELNSGRKGSSLFKLHHIDTPVPDFFVITPTVFREFVNKVFKEKKEDLLSKKEALEDRDIANSFSRFDFDEDVANEIIRDYTRLSGFTDAWVSVRSSVCFPKRPEISFSGLFDTQLNVRGTDSLMKAIKQVYASVYTDDVVKYCVDEDIELSEVSIAVVVQKMVQAEVSGVVFTIDPITQDDTRMSVEAVYGLGDVISNGEITPDSYVLLKKDLSILEKHIAPQEWMKVRTLKHGGSSMSEKIQISPNWSHKQKLEDNHMIEIAKIGLNVEDKLNGPQDIEWVLSGGRVWVLQTKDTYGKSRIMHDIKVGYHTFVSDSLYKVVKEITSSLDDASLLAQRVADDAKRFVKKEVKVEEIKTVVETVADIKPSISKDGDEFLLSGIGASFGVSQGNVKKVSKVEDKVSKGDIIVLKSYSGELYRTITLSAGVIIETGGLTSDIAILCRELNIPAVVGAVMASEKLKDGDIVKIDGNSGSVYLVDKAKGEQIQVAQEISEKVVQQEIIEQQIVTERTIESTVEKGESTKNGKDISVTISPSVVRDSNMARTATKVLSSGGASAQDMVNGDGVFYISLDRLMYGVGRHPLAFVEEKKYKEFAENVAKQIDTFADLINPSELVLSLGDVTLGKFRKMVKGKEYEDDESPSGTFGVTRYLGNKKLLEVALRVVKRVRNIMHDRNVSLALHSPMNGWSMKEIKKEINAAGLRRTSTFNVYAIIENPAEVIVLEEILDADIDGVILNTPSIAKLMQGISYDNEDIKYDLAVGSVYKVIDNIVDIVRTKRSKLIVVSENNKEIIKYSVSKGVHGITVNSEVAEIKKVVSEQEAKLLMGVR